MFSGDESKYDILMDSNMKELGIMQKSYRIVWCMFWGNLVMQRIGGTILCIGGNVPTQYIATCRWSVELGNYLSAHHFGGWRIVYTLSLFVPLYPHTGVETTH